MKISTVQTGAMTGALIGALIVGGNIFTNNAYELKPVGLSILNAGFSAISGAAMGAILGGRTGFSRLNRPMLFCIIAKKSITP